MFQRAGLRPSQSSSYVAAVMPAAAQWASPLRAQASGQIERRDKQGDKGDAMPWNLLESGYRRFRADVVACITCQDSGAGLPWNGELMASDGEWPKAAGVTVAA